MVLPFYLEQAHLTELSEEQAKYMGLSKTGGLERRFLLVSVTLTSVLMQALSNQTTIATSEDRYGCACQVLLQWQNSQFALYSFQWKFEH